LISLLPGLCVRCSCPGVSRRTDRHVRHRPQGSPGLGLRTNERLGKGHRQRALPHLVRPGEQVRVSNTSSANVPPKQIDRPRVPQDRPRHSRIVAHRRGPAGRHGILSSRNGPAAPPASHSADRCLGGEHTRWRRDGAPGGPLSTSVSSATTGIRARRPMPTPHWPPSVPSDDTVLVMPSWRWTDSPDLPYAPCARLARRSATRVRQRHGDPRQPGAPCFSSSPAERQWSFSCSIATSRGCSSNAPSWLGPDTLDINMGCSVRCVSGRGGRRVAATARSADHLQLSRALPHRVGKDPPGWDAGSRNSRVNGRLPGVRAHVSCPQTSVRRPRRLGHDCRRKHPCHPGDRQRDSSGWRISALRDTGAMVMIGRRAIRSVDLPPRPTPCSAAEIVGRLGVAAQSTTTVGAGWCVSAAPGAVPAAAADARGVGRRS
jgi:hypothetical protein